MQILSMTLRSDASAPGFARQAVAERLATHPRVDDLLLCVSEVVTNAVVHAGSLHGLRVSEDGPTVRVEVFDADAQGPLPTSPDPLSTSGRGLLILDQLAARWGSQPVGDGKTVWFELDR